ncbi:putative ESAT-6-like 6 domain protein [Mycobacterium kansasii]|uniref:Putative ESAT-6-like 6 domain protein n=1 Tax=Mycobacterium kansasii TaxID=1768 RepID=A0A1V3XN70_MYCKA|nr:putative ESAT-6-like 6 domain protein [Mycobacterium kansasii]
MTINYQFGDVDAHGATIRAQAASLEASTSHRSRCAGCRRLLGGAGSVACQEFITQLGRNFQVIYEQANAHGQKVQAAAATWHRPTARRLQLGLTSAGSERFGFRLRIAAGIRLYG